MRTLTSLLGNTQSLDGGAMFGNAPKAVWSRWLPPDADNRVPLACRALLIEEADGRRILCETGVGAFFSPDLRDRYGVVEAEHVLLTSLAAHGLTDADIDFVVLSHLHFDHVGGLFQAWESGKPKALLFPNARFIVGREAWARACTPHPRDRASFIPELPDLLRETGRLEIVDDSVENLLGAGYRVHFSDGHTPGLMLLEVDMPDGPVVFCGDLIPGTPWVHLPITMGYDRYPEKLIDEKTALLTDLLARNGRLFYTHDPNVAISRIAQDTRGRMSAVDPHGEFAGWTS